MCLNIIEQIQLKNQNSMEFDPHKKPTYILRHPFRFVKPYNHEYKTFAKKRWLGRKILDVLSKQFQAYSSQYFQQAIITGKITVNEKKVNINYAFKNSDLLTHLTVREEPPILDLPIEIIQEDEQFLIVCKPPSMVVHTGGGYHYNTLLAILHYQMGYQNLFILHRIDRLTSGVVILAKKKQKATKFHEESVQQVMKKCYFARVSGNVQFQQKTVQVPMICISHKEGVWSVFDPETMQQLLKTQQPKQSLTKFSKIWYDKESDSSLLECFPVTGRTHQIRVHLKHLGHPILNDTVYGGRFVGNPIIEKIKDLKQQVQNDKEIGDKVCKRIKQGQVADKQEQKDDGIEYEKWDYQNKSLEIFLHSFKYRFEDKQYISRKPYWVEKKLLGLQKWDQQKNQKITEGKKDFVKSKYEIEFLEERAGRKSTRKQEKVQQKYEEQNQKNNES